MTAQMLVHIGMLGVGIFFILLGWKFIVPKSKQWEDTHKKWNGLFKYGD